MTARDRAKMVRRLQHRFDYKTLGPVVCWEIECACIREVDRAVKAERAAFRATEELRAAHLRRADERMIQRARKGKS